MSTIVNHPDNIGGEIVLVERDGIQVLAEFHEGRVLADHVRLYDIVSKKELAYWSGDEFRDDPLDPSSAICAMLSAIELVSTGVYRERMEDNRRKMPES